jgi:hypothetical protein
VDSGAGLTVLVRKGTFPRKNHENSYFSSIPRAPQGWAASPGPERAKNSEAHPSSRTAPRPARPLYATRTQQPKSPPRALDPRRARAPCRKTEVGFATDPLEVIIIRTNGGGVAQPTPRPWASWPILRGGGGRMEKAGFLREKTWVFEFWSLFPLHICAFRGGHGPHIWPPWGSNHGYRAGLKRLSVCSFLIFSWISTRVVKIPPHMGRRFKGPHPPLE